VTAPRPGRSDGARKPVDAGTLAFRDDYRARRIGPHYRGVPHFVFVTAVALAVIGYAVARLSHVRPVEWFVLPLTLLVANLSEYVGHRFPMHRRFAPLAWVFQRHTLEHHAFFTHEAMEMDSPRDFQIVMFPPLVVVFFAAFFALPFGVLFFACVSPNAGWLFVVGALGYFLNYEWLHLAYHLPERSFVGRIAWLRRLREHHRLHHAPSDMTRVNFNVSYPLGDWLFGTVASRSRALTEGEAGPASQPLDDTRCSPHC
jgi:hypothetical protein